MLNRKIAALIILFLVSYTAYSHSAENPFPLPPSALSASYSEGSFSSMMNPVFTDLDTAGDLSLRYLSYNSINEANLLSSFNLLGFDFSLCMYNEIPDTKGDNILKSGTNLYSINRGFFFENVFGLGAGYSFTAGGDDYYNEFSGWNIGFLFRPSSYLSFGIVFRDLYGKIGDDKIERSDIYSMSLRPWGELLTLSADFIKKENEKFTRDGFFCSGELKLQNGISLSLKYETDNSFTAGLTMPLFIRSGNGVEIIPDFYASGRSETSGFYSAGVTFNLKKKSETIEIAPSQNFITIRINGDYSLEREEPSFFQKRKTVFQDLARGIEKAGNDPTITGIIIEIDNTGLGFAQIQEIRDLLNGCRSAGKKVYAILNFSGNREYYLATASDKIFFTPNSTFSITGLTVKTYFFKGLLDKAGVKYESFSKGKYKSFNEMFTRKDMSSEARENLTEVIRDLSDQFISGITESRKLTREDIEELFKKGFYTPAEAREKGFVDDILYANEARDLISKNINSILFEDYINEESQVTSWGPVPAIAVINVTGSIIYGEGGKTAMSDTTGDSDYKMAIDAAFNDPSVKAVVIRINSGGGSAIASDFMWNALRSAKKEKPKPVVFSFGNTAASGGYYIACTGDTIFAGKGTITGSIGVIAGKITAEGLYSKLGINTETIKMSEFADIMSESRSLTQNEKKLMQKEISFIYDRFTGKVMESRGISEKEIDQVAGGKIHTGAAAKNNKLINENGGIIAAIEYARFKSGLDSKCRIINLPYNRSFFEGLISDNISAQYFSNMQFIFQNIEKYRMLEEKTLYLQPYTIEIE